MSGESLKVLFAENDILFTFDRVRITEEDFFEVEGEGSRSNSSGTKRCNDGDFLGSC